MGFAKDTPRAQVRIGFDGRVHKLFRGPQAIDRFENEVRVLDYLGKRKCPFVPSLLEFEKARLYLATSNCGQVVDALSREKQAAIFAELEGFGVRHEDAEARNITYNPRLGRFCVIDFEFATILEPGYPASPKIESAADRRRWL